MKKATKQSTMLMLLNSGTITLVVLIVISFVFSILTNTRALNLQESETELILAAQDFVDASKYLTDQARACAATGMKSYYDNYENEVNVGKNRESSYARMEEIGITTEEQNMITQMSQISNQLVPLETSAMESAMSGNIQAAIDYVFGDEYAANLNEIQAQQKKFQQTIQLRFEKEIEQSRKAVAVIQVIEIVFVCAVICFQIFSILFTRHKIIRPLRMVQDELMEFANGNLSAVTKVEADTSELGMLVYSVNKMREQLRNYIIDIKQRLSQMADGNLDVRTDFEYIGDFLAIKTSMEEIGVSLSETLREIDMSANQVAAGAEQMSVGAQTLSQGATEQASSIQELSSMAQDISEKVNLNMKHTETVNSQVKEANEGLQESSRKMSELVSAMDEMKATSDQIRGIIKTIDDIAFQTNILALNAAVEAARAGAAGKGFAVVADEVRNLAGKSAEASKSTQELIENSIQAVDKGNVVAGDVAKALDRTSESTAQVVASVLEITAASEEQASAVGQMTQGLDQIASVVQTNSATAEESAAASEELSAQANMLKQSLEKFTFASEGR